MCDSDVKMATTIQVLAGTAKTPVRGFKEAIDEVKRQGRPLLIDTADAIAEKLGGGIGLADMLVEDLRRLRGDDLPEELKVIHDPDFKSIKGFYELIGRMFQQRDELVGGVKDPLEGVAQEDLMMIASEGAMIRIPVDAEFRRKVLSVIVEVDPEAVLDAAGSALQILDGRPKVEVIDAR